jgi:hypothetical protein
MTKPTNKNVLLPLVYSLQRCPSRQEGVSAQLMGDVWDRLKTESLSHTNRPAPAIMAALVLHHGTIGELLTGPERSQLLALANLAVERYEQRTNPPNKLGNLIAGTLKGKE